MMVPVKHPVIPIHDEHACAGRAPLPVRSPQLQAADQPGMQRVLRALESALCAPGAPLADVQDLGGWLRVCRMEPGEIELVLAAELGCRAEVVAAMAFDVLRQQVFDTDIFVHLEPVAPSPAMA
jgi:hypothetical protein